jgi:hypothetical protein
MATRKRSRTGCWTRGEAGYRCGDREPDCSRCIRLNSLCKAYGVKLKWQEYHWPTNPAQPLDYDFAYGTKQPCRYPPHSRIIPPRCIHISLLDLTFHWRAEPDFHRARIAPPPLYFLNPQYVVTEFSAYLAAVYGRP